MKASRILAGMSAAAFAASLISMVSFADEAAETKELSSASAASTTITVAKNQWGEGNTYNVSLGVFENNTPWSVLEAYSDLTLTAEIANVTVTQGTDAAPVEVKASDFSVQIYCQDNSAWGWNAIQASADADGKINASAKVSDLTAGKTDTNSIGAFGVQFGLSDEVGGKLAIDDTVTFDLTYTLTGTVDPSASEEKYELPHTEPNDVEPEWNGWGSDGVVPGGYLMAASGEKDLKVTVAFKNTVPAESKGDDANDFSSMKLCYADTGKAFFMPNAKDVYDEMVSEYGEDSEQAKAAAKNLWKADSIYGVDLASKLDNADDEKKARRDAGKGTPILQDDGFMLVYGDDSTAEFYITADAVKGAKEAITELGYGDLLFQIHGVDITSVTLEEVEPEAEPVYEYNAFEMYTDNWTYKQMSQEDADARGMGFTVSAAQTTYTAESATAYYDADGNLQYGEVPAGTDPYKVSGATVWNVDIDGLADAVGAGTAGLKNDDGSDLSAADKMKLAQDAGIEISNVKLLIDGKEFYSIPDDKLLYGDIEGNGKIRLEVYNEYGETGNSDGQFFDKDRVEAIAKESNAGTHYAVTFDITGIPEEAPDPVDTYSFTPADGYATTYTGNTGDVIDLAVALKQNGAPVADENVDWVFSSEAYSVQTIGAGENEVVVLPTDKDGISSGQYKCGSEAEIITVTATLENAEDYGNVSPVVFTIYQNIPDSQEDSSDADSSSSSSSSNTSSGGSSSSSSTTDNNPATGAAALGTVGILLAGAAMAVSKKKQ